MQSVVHVNSCSLSVWLLYSKGQTSIFVRIGDNVRLELVVTGLVAAQIRNDKKNRSILSDPMCEV